jgi:hypothetical protein
MVMKKIYLVISATAALFSFFILFNTKEIRVIYNEKKSGGEAEESAGRAEWELKRLADPSTGRIPPGIREKELEFANALPVLMESSPTSRLAANFTYRGPANVGGRTRALGVDIDDENIILAGTANGGMWRSSDGGVTWTRVSPLTTNPAISWVCQDQRGGHTDTWYYSTGEPIGPSSSATGAFFLGNGIYKSTDNGVTWSLLSSTSSGTPHVFENVWDLVWKVAADPSDTVNDIVYAATYGAIWRSVNGGTTWQVQRGSSSVSPFSYYTDVEVTHLGAVYATLSSDGAQGGVWRRDAINSWADISPPGWDTATLNRVVIGVKPSNENEVYFLGETPFSGKMTTNYKGEPEWTSLWKYTYLSGNGTGAGGVWTDLSANIPYDGSQLGNFNSQGGYDLVVRINALDTNTVFIGGTNLYRSTDGFTTSNNTLLIGGYDGTSTIPHYVNYPNNHSDQHNMFALFSNPRVMYQANDGGVYKTMDNSASPVVWQDLNNGYNTTQFYTVALDHGTPGNDIIIGGTQDNGTWWTNTQNASVPWQQPGRGDGAFCAIDNGHNFYYTSRQLGKLMKSTLDANGNTIAFERIDPISPDSIIYEFINPFAMDPNNSDIMYWAAANKIYRNDALTTIPLTGQWDSISTGWFLMPDSIPYAAARVSAIAVSTTPANRMYYGTDTKYLFRVDNANTNSPVTTEITSASFPANGNISCVAIDPNNADKLMVAFSNYAVYSIFYSGDAGATFTKVAGNLEANIAGTGAGPSVRWLTILPTANGYVYLAATSTGLYGTNLLNTTNTVWVKLAANEIGNLVADMIDARTSDGVVVVGTHGGGMFSATITDTLATSLAAPEASKNSFNVFPNPSNGNFQVFYYSSGHSEVKLFDVRGNLVKSKTSLSKGNIILKYNDEDLVPGTYFIQLKNGNKTEVKKIIINQ